MDVQKINDSALPPAFQLGGKIPSANVGTGAGGASLL